MKRIELEITDLNIHGMFAISLVDKPAIEAGWIALRDDRDIPQLFATQAEKRTITGPALIPNKAIYRKGEGGEEYEVLFRTDVVEAIAAKYMKEKRTDQVTAMHEIGVNGVYVTELWLIADTEKDKAAALGMTLPVGTLMVTMKIDNDEIWAGIKDGSLTGYSIEAYLNMEKVVLGAEMTPEERFIKAILAEIGE